MTKKCFNSIIVVLFAGLLAASAFSCDSDSDEDTDNNENGKKDAGGDDNGGDADSGVECDPCTDGLCIAEITGRVLFGDDTAASGLVQICTTNCFSAQIDGDGYFSLVFDPDLGCEMQFPEGQEIHVTTLDPVTENPGTHARFSSSYSPEAADVDDGVFDVGTLYLYELPADGFDYTAAGGADVSAEGLSFTVPAGALGDEDAVIKVFSYPLEERTPAFDNAQVDVLYFISPYAKSIEEDPGIALTVEAPDGYNDDDEVDFYILGDFVNGKYIECKEEELGIGEFAPCMTGTVTDGEIVTDSENTLTAFSWIGIKKK